MGVHNAKTSVEAINWYKNGSYGGIMPVRKRDGVTGKATGEIIGARKATLWDGIKIHFYSKQEKTELAHARGLAIMKHIHAEKASINENGRATFIDGRGRVREASRQDALGISVAGSVSGDHSLLSGPVLAKLLRKDALPAHAEIGTPVHEPFDGMDISRPSENRRNYSKANDRWAAFKGSPLAEQRAKWLYNPTNPASFAHRQLESITIRRTGRGANAFINLDNRSHGGASVKAGWSPLRERIVLTDPGKPSVTINYTEEGRFSTIATRPDELAPTNFPDKFTEYFETYNKDGILRIATETLADGTVEKKQPRVWTMVNRSTRDFRDNTATYSSPGKPDANGEVALETKRFSLGETVRHPKNLILQHTIGFYKGCFTVWQVLPDKNTPANNEHATGRWYKTTYNKDGKEVGPMILNRNGTYSLDGRPMASGTVATTDPYRFVSREQHQIDRQNVRKANGGTEDANVDFAPAALRASYDETAPAWTLFNPTGKHHRQQAPGATVTAEFVKDDALESPKYDKKYDAILTQGKAYIAQQIADLRDKKTSGAWDPLVDQFALDSFNADLTKIERVIRDRTRFNRTFNQSAVLAPKNLHLKLGRDVMERLEAAVRANGGLTEYKVGKGHNRHTFTPNIYQKSNWQDKVVSNLSPKAVAEHVQQFYDAIEANPNDQAAAREILRLFGSANHHLITDLQGNAKKHHFAHARLILMSDQLSEVMAAGTQAKRTAQHLIRELQTKQWEQVSLLPDAHGAISDEADTIKELYRSLKGYAAQIEQSLAHVGVLATQLEEGQAEYTQAATRDRRPALANSDEICEQAQDFDGEQGDYLQEAIKPMIARMEKKISGLDEEEDEVISHADSNVSLGGSSISHDPAEDIDSGFISRAGGGGLEVPEIMIEEAEPTPFPSLSASLAELFSSELPDLNLETTESHLPARVRLGTRFAQKPGPLEEVEDEPVLARASARLDSVSMHRVHLAQRAATLPKTSVVEVTIERPESPQYATIEEIRPRANTGDSVDGDSVDTVSVADSKVDDDENEFIPPAQEDPLVRPESPQYATIEEIRPRANTGDSVDTAIYTPMAPDPDAVRAQSMPVQQPSSPVVLRRATAPERVLLTPAHRLSTLSLLDEGALGVGAAINDGSQIHNLLDAKTW